MNNEAFITMSCFQAALVEKRMPDLYKKLAFGILDYAEGKEVGGAAAYLTQAEASSLSLSGIKFRIIES